MKFNVVQFPVTCPSTDFSNESDWTLKGFVVFSPSLVSEHLTRTLVDSDQQEIQSISSDIDLLLRMQNGQKLDKAIAEELLNRMSSGIEDSLKAVFDDASDEEILESVRSKYIQTPAQLEQYLKSLDSRLEDLSSQELQDAVDSSGVSSDKPVAEPSVE